MSQRNKSGGNASQKSLPWNFSEIHLKKLQKEILRWVNYNIEFYIPLVVKVQIYTSLPLSNKKRNPKMVLKEPSVLISAFFVLTTNFEDTDVASRMSDSNDLNAT